MNEQQRAMIRTALASDDLIALERGVDELLAQERERCAQLVLKLADEGEDEEGIAAAIRALGTTPRVLSTLTDGELR